jgi:hypothetical protein
VSFEVITLCVASQRVIPKVRVYFVIDSVRKLMDSLSYNVFTFSVLENINTGFSECIFNM